MTDLYRLVYTSRNHLEGGEDEQKAAVAGVLAVSKRNNARVGVTGALLFNSGSFAQVLEGSRAAVETTFERIQRDPRHSDVAVLQCEAVDHRAFPNWSMGFIGNSPRGRALWTEVARLTDFDLSRLEGNVLFSTLLSIVREEEVEAAQAAPSLVTGQIPIASPVPGPSPVPGHGAGSGLNVAQIRSELQAHLPGERAAPSSPAYSVPLRPRGPTEVDAGAAGPVARDAEVGVLRSALDAERARTTALRRELDDAQALTATLQARLAALGQEIEELGRHRDIWADRAKAMAAIMIREPALQGGEGQAAA